MFNNIKEIDAPELASWVQEKQPNMRVIDVRGMGEIASGTVSGAEAVPLHTLPVRLNEFKREEKLVFVCHIPAAARTCRPGLNVPRCDKQTPIFLLV